MDWIAKNLAKAIAIAVFVLLIIGVLFLRQCSATRNAHTETKLATGQAAAATESGRDSVNTVGNRMDADSAEDTITRTNDATIRNAPGANAPVDPALRDAGVDSLCRRAAYRGNPRCLQHADPR